MRGSAHENAMDRRRVWRITKQILLTAAALALLAGGARLLVRPTPVAVAEVTLRDIAPAIQGVGTVEAKVVVQVAAKITGRVVAVLADQGDTVRHGQVLARLDDAEQAAELQRYEAGLERTRHGIAAQEAALRKARASLAAAEASVARARANEAMARHDMRAAEASLGTARARRADTVVLGPLDGYVVSRDLEPGATVNPGTSII